MKVANRAGTIINCDTILHVNQFGPADIVCT